MMMAESTVSECDQHQLPDLTVYEYAHLLHAVFKEFASLCPDEEPLMTLCTQLSFFITSPNQCILQNQFNSYAKPLRLFFADFMAQLIASFLVNEDCDDNLKWIRFQDAPRRLRQLHFSCQDHIVDFRNMQNDYVNIRTRLLDSQSVYVVHIYLFCKEEEMSLGLWTLAVCDAHEPAECDPLLRRRRTILQNEWEDED